MIKNTFCFRNKICTINGFKSKINDYLGISCSEVSKDAANVFGLADNLATIVHTVEECRLIFDDLKKTFVYILTSNLSKIRPFLAWEVMAIPLPLSS